jgi:hypothetical protein
VPKPVKVPNPFKPVARMKRAVRHVTEIVPQSIHLVPGQLAQELGLVALKNRVEQRHYNRERYKDRNLVERFWNRLKHDRRVATRHEKTARPARPVPSVRVEQVRVLPLQPVRFIGHE